MLSTSEVGPILAFRNINVLNHLMINDQYKLDIVDQLVNCKTIKCNYVHYFMIINNYLFFDLTKSPRFSDLQIAAIGKRRTMIIFAEIYRFKYFFL
jgi:hypothetical protein